MRTGFPRPSHVIFACWAAFIAFPSASVSNTGPPRIQRISASPNPQFMPRLAPDGAGGVFVAWFEQNDSYRNAFVQHLDRNGNVVTGWPMRGVLATTGVDHLSLLADGNGGVFVALDAGGLYGSVGLHHVDARGTASVVWASPQTGESGRAESNLGAMKFDSGDAYPSMVLDGEGGVLFAWQHSTQLFGNNIYIQRFDTSNHSIWASPFNVTYFWTVGYPIIAPDGAGGAFVSWIDGYPTSWIVVSRVTRDGTLGSEWPASGIRACTDTHNQLPPGIVATANGAIMAWPDARDTTHEQVYVQGIGVDAKLGCNQDGLCVCSQPSAFEPNRFGFYGGPGGRAGSIVGDGTGGALLTWVDHRGGATADVYAQRVTSDGVTATGWLMNGSPVSTAQGDQLVPAIVTDGQGGAIVAWQDRRPDSPATLRWIRLDSSGHITADEPADGAVITATPDLSQEPVLCSDGATGAFVAWVDMGAPIAEVEVSHLLTDHIVPALVSLVEASAEPGRARLTWFVDEPGFTAVVERRDTGGWQDRANVEADATGRIEFEDREVAPGAVYEYRLRVGTGATATWTAEARVTIPAARVFDLAIANPAESRSLASISLPSSEPAALDLLDVSGRLVSHHEVGSLGAGTHRVPFDEGPALSAGIYVVRLRQGTLSLARRIVVVK